MAEANFDPNKLEFTFDELMTDNAIQEPLIVGDVLCHGGYVDETYVSPRSTFRRPAIDNWRRQLKGANHSLVCVPEKYVPPHYPSYQQAKFLLCEGVAEPIVRSLTIISIVEGFGARIRDVRVPDFDREIQGPLDGTALAHLSRGLFEAHARDEAGHRNQGGHKQMWEAARDVGLDKPRIPNDVLLRLMTAGSRGERKRLFPQLSERMEAMITMMTSVLVIETFAEKTFEWAERLLGDPEVSADPKRAAHIVRCIARDEIPHVDYLTVALSELRTKTLISEDGKTMFSGAEVVDQIFTEQLRGMATNRPQQNRDRLREEIHQALADGARASVVAGKFEALDAGWTFPHADDEALDVLLTPA